MTIYKSNPPQWALRLTKSDAKQFLRLVNAELTARGLDFSGTAPHLTDTQGRQIYLGNLAELCALTDRKNWQGEVTFFFDTITSISELADMSAMSADIVRRSLRIRLFVTLDDSSHDESSDLMRHIIRRPALPGTEWALYLRRPGSGQGVIHEHLQNWGIDIDEAFALARENTLAEEVATIYERDGIYLTSGGSLFAHAGVLAITDELPPASGYVVAVPNRHEALATRVTPDEAGLEAIVALMAENASRYAESSSPIHPFAWFVPETGIGQFGEHAEAIAFAFDERFDPDGPRVRFSPALNAHFAHLKAA